MGNLKTIYGLAFFSKASFFYYFSCKNRITTNYNHTNISNLAYYEQFTYILF